MSETAVCDITLKAIKATLKKYPRKKAIFNAFCTDNLIIDMEELTEDMASEILEIIDSAAYVKAYRDKKEAERKTHHELTVQTFREFLEDHSSEYFIIEEMGNCFLLCKKIYVKVQTSNNNSVFQPFEQVLDKTYFVNVIVNLSDKQEPTTLMQNFLMRGCKILNIYNADSVPRDLRSIN